MDGRVSEGWMEGKVGGRRIKGWLVGVLEEEAQTTQVCLWGACYSVLRSWESLTGNLGWPGRWLEELPPTPPSPLFPVFVRTPVALCNGRGDRCAF